VEIDVRKVSFPTVISRLSLVSRNGVSLRPSAHHDLLRLRVVDALRRAAPGTSRGASATRSNNTVSSPNADRTRIEYAHDLEVGARRRELTRAQDRVAFKAADGCLRAHSSLTTRIRRIHRHASHHFATISGRAASRENAHMRARRAGETPRPARADRAVKSDFSGYGPAIARDCGANDGWRVGEYGGS